ncbi:MAG: hypothetical protein NXI27_28225, partial [Alphaproteobacteria bacterium]|nr:hypothetical protein [Alphaproteobacteria bacterium]
KNTNDLVFLATNARSHSEALEHWCEAPKNTNDLVFLATNARSHSEALERAVNLAELPSGTSRATNAVEAALYGGLAGPPCLANTPMAAKGCRQEARHRFACGLCPPDPIQSV